MPFPGSSNRRARALSGLLALGVFTAAQCGEQGRGEIFHHAPVANPPTPESVKERHYAPSREIDLVHLTVEVTPDFKQRTVSGETTLTFKPIAKPIEELRLNAVDLKVSAVHATEAVRAYQATDREVIVTFVKPIPAEHEVRLTVAYSAEPRRGLYFRTPQMGYPAGEAHLFTQGEPSDARHWFPGFDAPNEKFTSEVIAHVPQRMTALSNGRLISEKPGPGAGFTTFRWRQEEPHVNYLVSLVVGPFKTLKDRHGRVPLGFHVLPSQLEQAENSFRDTRDMMGFFERETGVPYPWAKYDQVCVADFPFGGMENTSLSTLTDRTLFTPATENIRSSEGLISHELAHQWFGDLVTMKDWSHLWLNEGFATYYQYLYGAHKQGADVLLYKLYDDARRILQQTDTPPLVYREYGEPVEQFHYRTYAKGSWVVHMLRAQLGEDLYRRSIQTYLQRHRFGNVVTEDLNAVVEELSGRSFDQFFDQWVYHSHYPQLEVKYAWDEKTRLAQLSIAQTQALGPQVLLFNFPLTVRFKLPAGATIEREVTVKKPSEDYYFSLPQAPQIVRLDPDYTVLAKISFKRPDAMLYAQLADPSDMVGRLLAMDALSEKRDQTTIANLKRVLQNDAFYGVRVEVAETLRKIHTDEAFAALADSLAQPDARVRAAVVQALGGFYREESYAAIAALLERERNPAILALGLEEIGAYAKPQVRDRLLKFLRSESYRNELADAAIAAMRVQDDPVYIAQVREAIEQRATSFTTQGLVRAIDTLAYLGRNEPNRDALRELLSGFTRSPNSFVQRAALTALGTLEDPKALAVLKGFADATPGTPEQKAAEQALTALRSARKPTDDLKDLRGEVLELRKQTQEMMKELEKLRKQLDAGSAAPARQRGPRATRAGA